MHTDQVKTLIHEVLDERAGYASGLRRRAARRGKRKHMEASKVLICFASVMYSLTWMIAVYSWFTKGLLPDELMRYATYLYGVALAVYGGKSAYENKAKIDGAYELESMGYEKSEYP